MSIEVDRAGEGRGRVLDYYVWESTKSKSVSVRMLLSVDEWWDDQAGEWVSWADSDVIANCDVWIIGKDGKPKPDAVRCLCDLFGWDTCLSSIASRRLELCPVGYSVNEETNQKGEIRYKASFLRPYDSPAGARAASPERAKALDAEFGAQLRALRGNLDRAARPAPAGKPATPSQPSAASAGSRRAAKPRPQSQAQPAAQQQPPEAAQAPLPPGDQHAQDDIPF